MVKEAIGWISQRCIQLRRCPGAILISWLKALVIEPEIVQVDDLWGSPRTATRILSALTSMFVVLFIILLSLTLYSIFGNSKKFIVNARTERFEYLPASTDPPKIALRNATFFVKAEPEQAFEPSNQVKFESYPVQEGSLQVLGTARLVFSRIGTGSLRISVKTDQPALIYNEHDERQITLPGNFEFIMKEPGNFIKDGLGWQLNLQGEVTIGRAPTFDITQVNGLLLDGEIQMIAKKVLSHNPYTVDPVKLQLGDEIQFAENKNKGKVDGLVTFDDGRGMLIAAVVQADTATIKKAGNINLQIKNSLWGVLQQDEGFALGWAAVFFLPSVIAMATRWSSHYYEIKESRLRDRND